MDLKEELTSAGVAPTGPVSGWPKERHEALMLKHKPAATQPEIKASVGGMTKGLLRNAGMALKGGRVSAEVREERYSKCKACPAFRQNDKRCSECGCFMEAKTWINGNPKVLCPLKKWSR